MKIKLLTPILFLLPILMFAQGNVLLKKIQNKYKSVSDFSSGLVQYSYSADGTVMSKTNGTITYKKKNKFLVELGNHTIISDGINIWNHDKKFKRVVISSLTDDPTSFSLERYLYDYPALCNLKSISDPSLKSGEEILEMLPKDEFLDFKSLRIYKNVENLISKLEIVDIADMKYLFEFTNIKVNQQVSDNSFSFTTPKGVKVIDLR